MPPIPVRNTYKIRSPETWDLIRSAYVRGETAPSLAEQFDVTEWAIRNRARKQGWTKRAYAARMEGEPLASPQTAQRRQAATPMDTPSPAASPTPSASSVAEQAVAAASRAIAAGRYAEAERLGKLAETLSRLSGALAKGMGAEADADVAEGRGDEPDAPECAACALDRLRQEALWRTEALSAARGECRGARRMSRFAVFDPAVEARRPFIGFDCDADRPVYAGFGSSDGGSGRGARFMHALIAALDERRAALEAGPEQ